MRVWDISPRRLCRAHLLGEHREIHAIWSVIVNSRKGYARHPETMRWRGRLRALCMRHDAVAAEMARRGYCHQSPLDRRKSAGCAKQTVLLQPVSEQKRILRRKKCGCRA